MIGHTLLREAVLCLFFLLILVKCLGFLVLLIWLCSEAAGWSEYLVLDL